MEGMWPSLGGGESRMKQGLFRGVAWGRRVTCLLSLLLLLKGPGRFVELGTLLGAWPLGALAYILLAGYSALWCARLWCGTLSPGDKGGMACSLILSLCVLAMAFAPSVQACHCVSWNPAQLFSPYWRFLLWSGLWLGAEILSCWWFTHKKGDVP